MDVPFDFRKLTGPIEHWVTTYYQGYWGFREDKRDAWEEIRDGDVFVFHASRSKFLENAPRGSLNDLDTGIIGLGRVGAKSTKSEPAWWQEVHQDGDYPYLIHFSEIYWFGNVEKIRNAPVADKDVNEMVNDVHALAENIITFGEMSERASYRIPAQGSPTNIKQAEKLFPLLNERIESSFETPETDGRDDDSGVGSPVRNRSRDRNLDAETGRDRQVTYEHSVRETISATIDHEETLDTFEDYLRDRGFEGGETKHSDLIMESDGDVLLGEAKSIHEGNERDQIRKAIGQLFEYRYRDVQSDSNRQSLDPTLCLILSQEPTDDYQAILRSLEDDEIFTYWIDDGEIKGFEESMARLTTIIG